MLSLQPDIRSDHWPILLVRRPDSIATLHDSHKQYKRPLFFSRRHFLDSLCIRLYQEHIPAPSTSSHWCDTNTSHRCGRRRMQLWYRRLC